MSKLQSGEVEDRRAFQAKVTACAKTWRQGLGIIRGTAGPMEWLGEAGEASRSRLCFILQLGCLSWSVL